MSSYNYSNLNIREDTSQTLSLRDPTKSINETTNRSSRYLRRIFIALAVIILLIGVTGIIYAMVAVKGGASYNPDDPPDPVDPVNPYDGEFTLSASISINSGDYDYSAYN